ncbi:MAG: phosphoribosylanthranilate isomerase [Acidimicrobiia bacterium]
MTWIKICGITSEGALDAAVDAGADAVGFVVEPSSPRAITTAQAHTFAKRSRIRTYLVTVDRTPEEMAELASDTGVDGVQPHGRHSSAAVDAALTMGLSVLRPVSVSAKGPQIAVDTIPSQALPLFDTAASGRHGGTGTVFDWNLLPDTKRNYVLAGGLSIDNVADAIATVSPYGVDASSQLESSQGVKDPDMIVEFINRVRST